MLTLTLAYALCAVPSYEWRTRPDDPGRVYLYQAGRQLGGWDDAAGHWRSYDAASNSWGTPRPNLPAGVPAPPTFRMPAWAIHGMEWHPGMSGDSYRINGQDATREEVVEALEKGELSDDTRKLRFTVIGPEPDRKRVLQDLGTDPALAPYRDQLLVQAYGRDDWAVARYGFATDGHPTIYIQEPSGQVKHRQDDYSGPAELAATLEKIGARRVPDPNYRPEADPDLRRPDILPTGWQLPLLAMALALIPPMAAYLAFPRRRTA